MSNLPIDDNSNVSQIVSYNEPDHHSVDVGTSATNLTSEVNVKNRMSILVQSVSTNTAAVYIGFDNTVTTSHNGGTGGYELAVGQSISFDLAQSTQSQLRDIYAIAASGTQNLRILEV